MADACECICDPIFRLLRAIQAQSTYCADADCIQEGPEAGDSTRAYMNTALAIAGWVAAAGVMYYARPASLRANMNADATLEKANASNPTNNHNDRDQPPPPPSL
ncbi:hypothetical protein SARC_09393 [Sphaeroforma arctica JP610]|uniref:Small integral membrane protein 14 n=1 Tax=Sphaeroforma arctica JP610 TaxID=667725 RepID=A0A0L0FN12_9EUKA|nr:hypothetical protein SARC_09393 [Sphaeroforma arctica JP610]KNC78165.1 hypothetical protein SARC_09393 [Sphaeroforma arctica JP610]|eukprot:XP_014152067.1 hypothetical protein SARC_09393 [Sphaeroforma arctica JP610]